MAKELLGTFLVRKNGEKEIAAKIIETEAYVGPEDKASHAHKGKTKRNAPMFGKAGYWYVYICYGIHDMLNIVTGPKEYPAAVLIRGIELNGERINGPGKITKALSIQKTVFNEVKAEKTKQKDSLWIEDRGERVEEKQIKKGPRVGIQYAGPKWKKRHLRFYY